MIKPGDVKEGVRVLKWDVHLLDAFMLPLY